MLLPRFVLGSTRLTFYKQTAGSLANVPPPDRPAPVATSATADVWGPARRRGRSWEVEDVLGAL